MDYTQNQKPVTPQAAPELRENTGAGPLAPAPGSPTYSYDAKRLQVRSRLERVGYWVVVVAALALLLVLLGVFLPRFINGAILGFNIGLFVAVLTLLNLSRPAVWGNSVLGRKVFPVLQAPDKDIWRLAWVNAVLVFGFTFLFEVVASFVSFFFAGLIVFGALIALGIFYARTRSVIIKP
jgi:hypothetical protein